MVCLSLCLSVLVLVSVSVVQLEIVILSVDALRPHFRLRQAQSDFCVVYVVSQCLLCCTL